MVVPNMLFVLLVLSCIFSIHVADDENMDTRTEKKILILGAGMSGISAAKCLHENGYTNFQILEGSTRVGGRVKSVHLSGYTVELGAQWIYGIGSNPVPMLADEYNLDYTYELDTWTLRDKHGNDLTEEGDEEYDRLIAALDELDTYSRRMRLHNLPDLTAEAGLRYFGWTSDNKVADAVEMSEKEVESGKETPSLSGKYLYHSQVFREHGDDAWILVNDSRGFSFMIEQLKDIFISDNDTRLLYNKTVTRVENWNNSSVPVKVYTDDGAMYEADYVVVTFSLGVLQARLVVFNPSLPDWKMMAIDKFGFGYYSLLYFKFSTAFWDDSSTILYVPERHGHFCVWYNMNTVFPGCNILQVALTGSEATLADRLNDSELIAEGMSVLRAMYPSANISEPENFVASRWISDPLTMGSFSYWTPAFRPDDMDDLGQRIESLYFAGEHINQTNHGFVHSAYTSGMNTAFELMACIENDDVCKHREVKTDGDYWCTSGVAIPLSQLFSALALVSAARLTTVTA